MSSKADRKKMVFQGPGNSAANSVIPPDKGVAGGVLHSLTGPWVDNKYRQLTVGDMYDLAGFREKKPPHHQRSRKLTVEQVAVVVKVLEAETTMNYHHGGGYGGMGVQACCTCL